MKLGRERKIIYALMLAGFLLRLIYVLSVPYDVSAHDLGRITASSEPTIGHLGYICYLLQNGRLPDFDPRAVMCYYNPPFFYVVSALWMRLQMLCGAELYAAASGLRALTLLSATAAVYFIVRIMEEFGVGGRRLLLLTGFISFFPAFTWLSGALTPDGPALALTLLATLYSLRWYKRPGVKNILIAALAIGLAVMTKPTSAFAAPGMALLFLLRLLRSRGRRETLTYLGQFALFALVSLPLGLFWPLRSYLLFGVPPGYVPLSDEAAQYIGDAGLWARLGLPRLEQLTYPRVHFDPRTDTNIWLTMIRTALYDEHRALLLETVPFKIIGVLLLWLSLALALGMTGCLAAALVRRASPPDRDMRLWLLLNYAPLFVSYIIFCFSFPHICSMNYRYIVFLTLPPMLGTALVLREGTPLYRLFRIAVSIFCLTSAVVYLRYSISLW